MSYYKNIENRLQQYSVFKVFPYIRGLYEFKKNDEESILLEHSKTDTFVRFKLTKQTLISDDSLNEYGKYIRPRTCNISSIIKALKKLDESCMDGVCLLQCDDDFIFLRSKVCNEAVVQFKHWLLSSLEFVTTLDDLHHLTNMQNDPEEMAFCTKYYYYLLNNHSNMIHEADLKTCITNILEQDEKNYLI